MRFASSKSGLLVLALTLGAMSTIPASGWSAARTHASHDPVAQPAAEALRTAMRGLWQDHVSWTRFVIVSTAANLPDLEATTRRLLQNQADIGNAVKPYYGDAAGDKLTALLGAHIVGAAELLAAAQAGDAVKLAAAKEAWYANGDEIAAFLNGANPEHWPLGDLQTMMRTHLDLTLTEAVDQLQGRYAESVADYGRAQEEILQMADMLSDGIVQQFSRAFAKRSS